MGECRGLDKTRKALNEAPWEVNVTNCSDCVFVYPIKGMTTFVEGYGSSIVTVPNFIERSFGVTFESKLNRAVEKTQKVVDRLNKRETTVNEQYKKWKEGR